MSTPPPTTLSSTPGALRQPAPLSPDERRDLVRELVAESRRLTRVIELLDDESADDASVAARRLELLARRDEFAQALERVAAGDYGTCAVCRTSIPYGRLLMRPEAACCTDCAAAIA
jgi:RNA polymerase-binding transcription factor DksA